MTRNMSPLKIIIVGAGVGGPAAAVGLAKNGHDVSIYERSKSGPEVGYAFRVTANSDRCLKYFGVDAEAGGAMPANSGQMLDVDGKVVGGLQENKSGSKAKGGVSVFAFRPQLNRQLMDEAKRRGVHVYTGVKVKSVDVEATSIELEDGTSVSADLIIAADGLHSLIRPSIVDSTKHHPEPSLNQSAFRFMLSTSDLKSDPLMSTIVSDESRLFSWSSGNKRVIAYPVDYGKQYNFVCSFPTESYHVPESKNESAKMDYNQKVPVETVKEIYSGFEPRVERLLSMADPDGFRMWNLMDMAPLPTWTKNYTTMLGDACHPVLPFSFSGASMAIEDAATLSVLLPADVKKDELGARLKMYEELRMPRVARVRQGGQHIGAGKEDGQFMKEYMMFLSSHDAVEYANEKLRQL